MEDYQIDRAIARAHRRRVGDFGKYVREWFALSDEDIRTFDLFSRPINSIVEVYRNDRGNPLTVTTQYTVSTDLGQVTIVDGVGSVGDNFYIWYIPEFFEDAESAIASEIILGNLGIHTTAGDGIGNQMLRGIRHDLNHLYLMMQSFPAMGTAKISNRPSQLSRRQS